MQTPGPEGDLAGTAAGRDALRGYEMGVSRQVEGFDSASANRCISCPESSRIDNQNHFRLS